MWGLTHTSWLGRLFYDNGFLHCKLDEHRGRNHETLGDDNSCGPWRFYFHSVLANLRAIHIPRCYNLFSSLRKMLRFLQWPLSGWRRKERSLRGQMRIWAGKM
jgi:hypothetical protein